jgi:trk system potassium uptake protein TrkH
LLSVGSKKSDNSAERPAKVLDYSSLQDPGADVVRWLFPAYIFLILVGFFALRLPGVQPAGNDLNPDRAVFTSVNAGTLTGFQLSIHPSEFGMVGKIVLLLLTVAGTLFTLIVGGLAVKRILRLPWPDMRLVRAALVCEAFVLVIGAFGSGGEQKTLLGAVFQSAAAFGNSGLYVDVPPGATETYTWVVLMPLAVIGGLGMVVLLEIYDWIVRGVALSRHTRVVLETSAAVFLIGFVGCVLFQWMDLDAVGKLRDESWPRAFGRLLPRVLTNAAVMSIDARTAGMAVLPVYSFPHTMAFLVMLLMAVGASPGGTGGGLKTTTVHELLTGPRRLLKGMPLSRTFGIAMTWLGIYVAGVLFFHAMLLWAEPQMAGDRVLFVTVSAMSNVGLSHDVLSMTRSSLLIVSAAMFFGRVTPLLVLWWMADTTRDAEVAVG